ncbi:MAG: hypothetical protein IPL75_19380 [Acidobacteria bacterium]|nr:hypothetical protein [Acidobacteriota bacterium]
MALGPDLPDLMQSLTAVQDEIRTRGGLICFDPSAQVEILNITGPGWHAIDQFGKGGNSPGCVADDGRCSVGSCTRQACRCSPRSVSFGS